MTIHSGRSGADAPSGHSAEPEPSRTVSAVPVSVPNAAIAGAHNWEVGPCVDRLGHITSWDINIRPREGDKGVAVIASVYSGEEAARAILAAIQAAVEHPLARMVRLDEELGLYDDEPLNTRTASSRGRLRMENTCAFVDRFGKEVRTSAEAYGEIKFLREKLEIALDAIRSAERETDWTSGDGFDAESLADVIEAQALWWCGARQTSVTTEGDS